MRHANRLYLIVRKKKKSANKGKRMQVFVTYICAGDPFQSGLVRAQQRHQGVIQDENIRRQQDHLTADCQPRCDPSQPQQLTQDTRDVFDSKNPASPNQIRKCYKPAVYNSRSCRYSEEITLGGDSAGCAPDTSSLSNPVSAVDATYYRSTNPAKGSFPVPCASERNQTV